MRSDRSFQLSDFRHIEPIPVRFRDIDALGHVNNAVYATYFEMGRIGYFRALTGSTNRRPAIVIAELQLSFRAPAYLDDTLRCGVRISTLGRKSFVMEYLLVRDEDQLLIAGGRSVQVAYDHSAGQSIWISDEFRSQVTAFEGRELPRSDSNA